MNLALRRRLKANGELPSAAAKVFLPEVSKLSNLPGGADGRGSPPRPACPPGVVCRIAADNERRAALSLVLGSDGRPASETQVGDFIHFAASRNIRLEDLWLAESNGRLLWAVLPVMSPGRTLLMLAPTGGLRPSLRPAAAALIETICQMFAARGVHLAQVLLDPEEDGLRSLFTECGLSDVAELIYLQSGIPRGAAAPPTPNGLSVRNHSPAAEADFKRAILASYRQSLDCPALNGLRDIDDVIAGHRATGDFDPRLWWLVEGEAGSAVLLLSRMPRSDNIELVYLGVSPELRGRGVGRWLMKLALSAAAAERRRLTLAVDSANLPALKLYYAHGLQKLATKVAMIRDLRRLEPAGRQ